MNQISKEHWLLAVAFLGAIALTLSGLKTWGEALQPAVLGGFFAQIGIAIRLALVPSPQGATQVAPKTDTTPATNVVPVEFVKE